jgi:hypothetical protein
VGPTLIGSHLVMLEYGSRRGKLKLTALGIGTSGLEEPTAPARCPETYGMVLHFGVYQRLLRHMPIHLVRGWAIERES